jgi:hypothetical protein
MGTWRGGREARNARIQRVLCEGEDSPETMRMKALAEGKERHPAQGICGGRWRTKRGDAPRGLGEEEWLFERAARVVYEEGEDEDGTMYSSSDEYDSDFAFY